MYINIQENKKGDFKMIRKIIKIDEDKCNGCGLCADACHEQAIIMVNNKARLIKDDYCDGLGDCLPVCPTNAISFEEREAAPYDEAAVKKRIAENSKPQGFTCPGTKSKTIERTSEPAFMPADQLSQLRQWPVQINLVAENASFFNGAHLLIAADCTAYAYADFHGKFIKNKIALIGCPKLDSTDYSIKLAAIIKKNDIKSVTIVRMEVPCCFGIETAAIEALKQSGKMIPWNVNVISTEGNLISSM